jgi:hypothetical protein
MNQPVYRPCGLDASVCKSAHPATPWTERSRTPLADRIAAREPAPAPDRRPAWLARLTARDMTGVAR